MKYLILTKNKEGAYKLTWEFGDIQSAVSYYLTHKLGLDSIIVKVVDEWKISEKD